MPLNLVIVTPHLIFRQHCALATVKWGCLLYQYFRKRLIRRRTVSASARQRGHRSRSKLNYGMDSELLQGTANIIK